MEHKSHLQVVVQVEKGIGPQVELGPGIEDYKGPREATDAAGTFLTCRNHWQGVSEKAPYVLLACMDPQVVAYAQVLDMLLTYMGLPAEAYVLLACTDPLVEAYLQVHNVPLTCMDPLDEGYELEQGVLLTYKGLLVEAYEHAVDVLLTYINPLVEANVQVPDILPVCTGLQVEVTEQEGVCPRYIGDLPPEAQRKSAGTLTTACGPVSN